MSPVSPEVKDVVERLFEVLVEEIRSSRPELVGEAFTVAEIYQNLVPYRTHRNRIGTEMNGDYEHALLRLLAGEGGYLVLESEAARGRLREELDAVHPDTGIYRNFAACEVRLNPERSASEGSGEQEPPAAWAASEVPVTGGGETAADERAPDAEAEDGGRSGEAPDAEAGAWMAEGDDALTVAEAEARGDASSGDGEPGDRFDTGELPGNGVGGTDSHAEEEHACSWCRERLPERDDLRFCPFCGCRADLYPCPECGAELEESWHFCLACGTELGG